MIDERRRPVAILGAGVMGTGIAALALGHGIGVVLIDRDEAVLERAAAMVDEKLRVARLLGRFPREAAEGELRISSSPADVAVADTIIEAVIEIPAEKAKVLAEVSALIEPGTPIASNTSAVPIDTLADHAVRPRDVVGAHFMNPPQLIRGVEVVRGPRTSEAALSAIMALLAALTCRPVVVGDGPGFVINRILQRMINESARIAQEGIASPESIDDLFKGCLGHSTGPLATADLIGLDNVTDTLRVLHEWTGDPGYEPCDLLLSKVKAGDFGRKTGRGFYAY